MNKRLVDMDNAEVETNAAYAYARKEQLSAERSRLSDEYVRKEHKVGDTSKERRTSAAANELWCIKQAMYLNELELTHWQRRYTVYSAEVVHRGLENWTSLRAILEGVTHEW